MYLAGFFLAHYREADYDAREAEGYYARYGTPAYVRLCSYEDDPKAKLLALLPEPCRPFVTWGNL